MITDNGKLDYVDPYGTIYFVQWEKIDDNYQVTTRTDTPFLYGKRTKHTASGVSPFITLLALGRRTEIVQYLSPGVAKPLKEIILKDEEIYIPVSPNSLIKTKPFKYDLGSNIMPTDFAEHYCLEGPHFTYDIAIANEDASIWPVVNNDGSVVANSLNLVFISVW